MGGTFFSRNRFLLENKKMTSSQEEQGSNKVPPVRKAVRQGFDPELFMTELLCHQLGAKLKQVILTFGPESTYQHQKIKYSCRCGERVRLKMSLPAVLAENNKKCSPGRKGLQNGRNIFFPKMSKIHFPGLRTLR